MCEQPAFDVFAEVPTKFNTACFSAMVATRRTECREMRKLIWGGIFVVGSVTSTSSIAANMALDTPLQKGEIQAVCTGVGSAKQDSRWTTYPVRVVFSNRASQYIAGEHIVLSQAGKQKLTLDCGAPWILFRLPEGNYSLKATLPDQAEVLARGATITSRNGAPRQRVGIVFSELQPNQ